MTIHLVAAPTATPAPQRHQPHPAPVAMPFEEACEDAKRRGLYLEPPAPTPPRGRAVVRPFFVVRDPQTGIAYEVAFNGRRLLCSCGAAAWCGEQAAVWAQIAGAEQPPQHG